MHVSSGVEGFDRLVDGGLPAERLYILCGPPGSGKTTFCAQFAAAGARDGEKALFVSMHESKSDLAEDMSGFEFGFERAVESDAISFLDTFTPGGRRFLGLTDGSHDRNGLSGRLVSYIDSNDIDRVVIDSTMLLRYLIDDEEDTLIDFLTALKRADATVLIISEMTDPDAYATEHYLAHGVVFMHNYLDDGGMTRGIQVLKIRGVDCDTNIHELEFDDDGLHVGGATPLTP
ncbi:MAG: RAD55 family ATPase [Halarchaeum sp.]